MAVVAINWLAVLVAVVAQMVCGALWYGPLFGKTWMKLVGKTEEDLKQGNVALAYITSILAAAICAIGLSCLVDLLAWQSAMGGIKLGFYAWLTFTATAMFMNDAFEGKPKGLTILNALFHLVYFMLIGAIVGAWQ